MNLMTQIEEKLRELYGYDLYFDIALIGAFESEARAQQHFPFYETLGKRIKERCGKFTFLPHKELDLSWPSRKIHNMTNYIIIPSVDLVIVHTGIDSAEGKNMLERAELYRKPMIEVQESLPRREMTKEQKELLLVCIPFTDQMQTVDDVVEVVETYYGCVERNSPQLKYKN